MWYDDEDDSNDYSIWKLEKVKKREGGVRGGGGKGGGQFVQAERTGHKSGDDDDIDVSNILISEILNL